MKKNISVSKDVYQKAVEDAKAVYDYLFAGKPVFVSPNRAAFVAYEALTQITGAPIDSDEFDQEYHKAYNCDGYPGNMSGKINFMMGWFEGFLDIEIIEEE